MNNQKDLDLITLTMHQDPGHGWLECPKSLAKDLGVLEQLSNYSYISADGKKLYLEEDCDAAVILSALKQRGSAVRIVERNSDDYSFIRALNRF